MRSTFLLLAAAAAILSSCGGGSGGGVKSTPTPSTPPPVTPPGDPTAPAPAPAPSPGPAPTPTVYDTPEYERSTGVVQAHAIAAYDAGATGSGITAAIVDSGIDAHSSYFTGRISATSQDVAGSRGIQDTSGHGTAVAAVLGAARDGNDILGMAFDANLLVLRTDSPGSCAGDKGCQHDDGDIARAIDIATANHARVVNVSLGGSPASTALRNAIGRATAAGIVIVISAGNDGTANPDPLALVANDSVANGLVVIAGATKVDGTAADFSDKAGSGAAHYLDALGESVPSIDEAGRRYLYSGTSFSAPHIAGAIALLAQAFPNLSGAQLVSLLFRSASDAGAAGVDSIYGNGVLNLARAFAPQGSMSLAGEVRAPVSLSDNGRLSAPMGDALGGGAQQAINAVILDGYDRAYALDLARTIGRAAPALRLAGQLRTEARSLSLAAGAGATIAFSVVGRSGGAATFAPLPLDAATPGRAQLSAATLTTRVGRSGALAIGIAGDGRTLSARLAGGSGPASMIAPDIFAEPGFARQPGAAAAYRRRFGPFGLSVSGETGDVTSYGTRDDAREPRLTRSPYTALSLGFDRHAGALALGFAATRLDERSSVLGARFGAALDGGGATSWFIDGEAGLTLSGGWSARLRTRRGWTEVPAGGAMTRDGRLATSAYAIDVAKAAVVGHDDSLALRLALPLRVASGGFELNLPVSYDYSDQKAGYAAQRLDLAPAGREVDIEAVYGRPLWGGWINANLFCRRDPGNVAALPDDRGAALRFAIGF